MVKNMNENNVEIYSTSNIQSEILFVGSLYKCPDLFVSYGNFMRSQYDFSDNATKFFYDMFEMMYTTFSQTVEESKVNIFMSQDDERLRQYKRYKGWKTISSWIELADENDFKNYYNTIKKYSLVREYERNGYPVKRIVEHRNFEKWTAQDIYRIIRSKADKINTIINANEESVDLTDGNTKQIEKLLISPDMGLSTPWTLLNEMFRGCRLGKVYFNGFRSNEGKSRNLMLLAAYISLVKGEKFLFISNEMDVDSLRNCLITTVINNDCFKELHGVDITKCEREIVLGLYRDENGEFIKRKTDKDGNFIESVEDYINRVRRDSEEFRKVEEVSNWIDRKKEGRLFFKDVGSDYSDEALEFEFRKHKMIYGIKYCGYDTLKSYKIEEWGVLKQTATKLKELMKELNMFCWAVFQLTDSSIYLDVFDLTSNEIANSKAIKHVVDALMLGAKIQKDDYNKYQYMPINDDWGEPHLCNLKEDKTYFALKIDKNRMGSKQYVPLFEINLDLNTWDNIGYLLKK